MEETQDRIEKMLDHLPDIYRYALEARHESWFVDEVFDYLRARNICLVWNEVEGVDNPAPLTTDFVYLRMIGDRSIPENQFGEIQKDRTKDMGRWKSKLLSTEVRTAMIMWNNHFAGFAPGSANQFRKLMGLEELSFADKKQTTLDF